MSITLPNRPLEMKPPSLRLLVLKTVDIDRLVKFYHFLGFDFTEEQHGPGPVHYSAPLGGGILEIYRLANGAVTDTNVRLGLAVSDPDRVVANVDSLGAKVIKPGRTTKWGYMAIVSDPDGRSVELYRANEQSA